MRFTDQNSKSEINTESGMSLLAVLAVMTLFAILLLAAAPTIQQEVQREKELEAIRRGEEVAYAISEYVTFYQGKLPDSMDDLLEGLPQGTQKRQILRPSAAIDPLSADGEWRLISPTSKALGNFTRRIQNYNNGSLSVAGPNRFVNQYAQGVAGIITTDDADDVTEAADEEYEDTTDDTEFIGVSSQSKSRSVIAYYGIENHSKWVFTPLFRDLGGLQQNQAGQGNGGNMNSNTITNTRPRPTRRP